MNNRLLLYVHFNRNNDLSEHVVYQLQHLRQNFEEIFFISNSLLAKQKVEQLTDSKLIDGFMQRENKGYDFAAWSEAMKYYGFEQLENYDSVTIMNDTCFGPVYDFTSAFEKMDSDNQISFWGITNNRSHKVKPWEDKEAVVLPDHIQSYFVSYKRDIVQSESFKKFWSTIEILSDVVEVIIKYETAMTKFFEKAGFKSAVLFDTRKQDWTGMVVHDFSVFNLPELLKRKIPFLKIKAFSYGADYPYTPFVIEQIKGETAYPVKLIVNHMTEVDYPDREYMLLEKILTFSDKATKKTALKIGIHLHASHPELIQEYLNYFDQYIQNYELYITTDSEEKKEKILENYSISQLKTVIATQSDDKGTLAWLTISSSLEKYDLCGHFYTKKSENNEWIVEEAYRRDIELALLKPAQEIFEKFEKNQKVGIVVTDVSLFYKSFENQNFTASWDDMVKIWQIIDHRKNQDLKEINDNKIKYNAMIWYRPQALQNIYKSDIKERTLKELLLSTGGVESFEKLLIYISWGNGYDFRISRGSVKKNLIIEKSDNQAISANTIDFTQIRIRKLLKELFRKFKIITIYRLKLKK